MGNGVPVPPAPFVGRKVELDYLKRAVRPGRVVALSGAGDSAGIGKTGLAQVFAHTEGRFEGALWWSIPLDGDHPHQALRRWAMRGGVAVEGLATMPALLEAVSGAIAGHGPLLVVIDGVGTEHVATVRAVLAALPGTTAVLLTAEDESVPGQLGARAVVIEPLLDEEGHELLRRVVEHEVPPIIAGALLESVAFRPLGIRMAGARLRMMQSDESTGIWGGKVDPQMVTRLGGPAPMARTLLDVYRRLTDEGQATFRALGVFAHGPLRTEQVALVLACTEDDAYRRVLDLADMGLVEGAGAAGRWHVHPLLRVYARRLLDLGDDTHLLMQRRLSAVIAAGGAATSEVSAVGVLDVIEHTLAHGDADDAVALATRAGEAVGAWCLEVGRELVSRALDLAREEGHRAANMLQGRLERFTAQAEDEARLDDDLDLDLVALEGVPASPTPGIAETVGVAFDAVQDDEIVYEAVAYDDEDAWWMGDDADAVWEAPAEMSLAPEVDPGETAFEFDEPEEAAAPAPMPESAGEIDQIPTQMLAREQLMAAIMAARAEEQAREAEDTGDAPSMEAPGVAAFIEAHGLGIGPDDTGDAFLEDDAQERGGIFGIGRMVSKMRGDDAATTLAEDRARAALAASACLDMHERSLELVAGGVRDAREAAEDDVASALEGLANAVRKVREHTLAAGTAAQRVEASEDPAEVRGLASAAERHRELAGRALVVVEATWSTLQDCVVDAVETRALRAASVHRARRDLALARQNVEEGARRAEVRVASLSEDDLDTRGAIEAHLADARRAMAELEEVVAAMEAGTQDAELGANEAERLRAEAEGAAQQALSFAGAQARAMREEARRDEAIQEAEEQLERLQRDAGFASDLADEVHQILGEHDDPEARDLRARLERVVTDIRVHREEGVQAFAQLGEAESTAWPQHQAAVAASARGLAVALAEAERLRSELDGWSAAMGEEDAELVLAGLHAEAATAEASLEATTAVARHASSRAHQAASHMQDLDLSDQLAALQEAETQLRDVRTAARRALREIVQTTDAGIARDRWSLARTALDMAREVSDEARRLAEGVLATADAARRQQLEALVEEGQTAAKQVGKTLAQVSLTLDAVREAWGAVGEEPTHDLDALLARGESAREAVTDGVARLMRAREPGLAVRIVEALVDAADVVGAVLMEATELKRSVDEAIAARSNPDARRAVATEALEEAAAAVAAAQVDVDEVQASAGATFGPIVKVALSESLRELSQATTLLADAPAFDGPAETWFDVADEVEGRAGAVARIAERVRQGTVAAQRLIESAMARHEEKAAQAREELDDRLSHVRVAVEAAVAVADEPLEIDDAWPVPVLSVATAVNAARDGVLGAAVALDALAASGTVADLDAVTEQAAAVQCRAEGEASRLVRRRADLADALASWQEHAQGRRAGGAAFIAATVASTLAGLEGFEEAAGTLVKGSSLAAEAEQIVAARGDVSDDALQGLHRSWVAWRMEASMAEMLADEARQARLDALVDGAQAVADLSRDCVAAVRASLLGVQGDDIAALLVALDAGVAEVQAAAEGAAQAVDEGLPAVSAHADAADEAWHRLQALAEEAPALRAAALLAAAPSTDEVQAHAAAAQVAFARAASAGQGEGWSALVEARAVLARAVAAHGSFADDPSRAARAAHAAVRASELVTALAAQVLPTVVVADVPPEASPVSGLEDAVVRLSAWRRGAARWVRGWRDAQVTVAYQQVEEALTQGWEAVRAARAPRAGADAGARLEASLSQVSDRMDALAALLVARRAALTQERSEPAGSWRRALDQARRAAAPPARVEAAMAAIEASDGSQPDLSAALWLRAASAWLAMGHPARARGCVDAARALAADPEVVSTVASLDAVVTRAASANLSATGAPAAWAASKDARRRARRVMSP